jgi:hypothetical protein
MTFSEEFRTSQEQDFEEGVEYPVAFGITFTPQVQMYSLIALGVIGFLYILMNMTMPAWETLKTKQSEQADLKSQVEAQKSGEYGKKIKKLELELQKKEVLKQQVLALFADENNLKTLLLDVNQFFKSRNVDLISFTPTDPVIIEDSSLGAALNNKLKKQTVSLEMEGDFQQIYSIIRDLERLQPLILVNNLSANVEDGGNEVFVVTAPEGTQVIRGGATKVKVVAQISVILPLTPEEAAQAAAPPAEAPK